MLQHLPQPVHPLGFPDFPAARPCRNSRSDGLHAPASLPKIPPLVRRSPALPIPAADDGDSASPASVHYDQSSPLSPMYPPAFPAAASAGTHPDSTDPSAYSLRRSLFSDDLLSPDAHPGAFSASPSSSPQHRPGAHMSLGAPAYSFPPPSMTSHQFPPYGPSPTDSRYAQQQTPFAFHPPAHSPSQPIPTSQSPRPSSSYSSSSYNSLGHGHDVYQQAHSRISNDSGTTVTPSSWPGKVELLHHSASFSGPTSSGSDVAPVSPIYAGSVSSDTSGLGSGSPTLPPLRGTPGAQRPGGTQNLATSAQGQVQRGSNGKTYSFVSLPGNAVKKRPRRRYDEIERLYHCSWPNCTKAYGTLNHLNAHVTMQKHGQKRSPGEFKELRKQWRQAKKEAEEAQQREVQQREAQAQAQAQAYSGMVSSLGSYSHHQHQPAHHQHAQHHASSQHGHVQTHQALHPYAVVPQHELDHHRSQRRHMQDQMAYAQGHGGYASPPAYSLSTVERYALPSPVDEVPHHHQQHHSQQQQQHHQQQQMRYATQHQEEDMQEMAGYYRHPQTPTHAEMGMAAPTGWPGHPEQQSSRHGYYQAQSQGQQSGGTVLPPPSSLSAFPPPQLPGSNSDLPQLTAHVSLGRNTLPPDSTLLTPLPGYEPEVMGPGQHQEEGAEGRTSYGRSPEGYFD